MINKDIGDYFFQTCSDFLVFYNQNEEVFTLNPSFSKFLRLQSSELSKSEFYDLVSGDIDQFNNIFSGSNTSNIEFVLKFHSIQPATIWKFKTDINYFIGVGKIQVDPVTPSLLFKNHTSENKIKFLSTVLDSIPEIVALIDQNFKITYINIPGAAILGFHVHDIVGKYVLDINHPNITNQVYEDIAQVLHTCKPLKKEIQVASKEKLFYLEIYLYPFCVDGNSRSVVYTTRDITDLQLQKRIVISSENKLKKIIDLVPYPIFLKDKDFQYSLINNAQADLFQVDTNELIGKSDKDFVIDSLQSKVIEESDHKIIQGQVSVILSEQVISTVHGTKKILHTTKIPFFNELEDSWNILGISVDITEIKLKEEELKRINFELDSFVYRSSHDLRAPLRSLIGLINLSKIETDIEVRNDILERALKSIDRLDNFILDLTNFSRNSRLSIKHEKVDFNKIIEECLDSLKFMEGNRMIDIKIKINPEVPFYSDSSRISILCMNMISNAIKYQNYNISNPFVKIYIATTEKGAYFKITDNGIGIDNKMQDKIFDMFFRASENSFGSGLGLYIVKQTVNKLRGTIKVNSEIEVGTIFEIELPHLERSIED